MLQLHPSSLRRPPGRALRAYGRGKCGVQIRFWNRRALAAIAVAAVYALASRAVNRGCRSWSGLGIARGGG